MTPNVIAVPVSLARGLFHRLLSFLAEHRVLTIGVFAAIFTWGLVQEVRRTLLSPVIRRHFIPGLEIDTRKPTRIRVGELVVAVIEWCLLMVLLFVISVALDLAEPLFFADDPAAAPAPLSVPPQH